MASLQVISSGRRQPFIRSFSQFHAKPFFNSLLKEGQEGERDHLRSGKVLRMLMFGKPGAGKGTLSAKLVNKYDIKTVSTGDLLRQHIIDGTEVGRQTEDIVAHGGLIPDDIMLKVVTSALSVLQNKHWILDGFPRTLIQGEMLDFHLQQLGTPLTLVLNLDVPDRVILSRISDRWVHLASGRVYNMSYNRPQVDGLDDVTGEALSKRPDDNPEIFARRLTKFYESTSPLLTYYNASSKRYTPSPPHRNPHQHPHQLSFPIRPPHRLILETLSGRTSDEIWPKLDAAVRNAFPALKERQDNLDVSRALVESRDSPALLTMQ